MPYNFPDEIQREIDAFAEDNAGRVDQEIRIVRWLIQRAVTDGRHPLANSLLATLAKLSTTEIENQVRSGQLLELSAIVRIAREMCAAVGRRLDGLPNQEALSDALLADFKQIIQTERRLLTHDPQTSGDNNASSGN